MITASERRQGILNTLSNSRRATMAALAIKFGVNQRTIQRDIEILSCSAPIFTAQGNGGGVYVAEGWYLSRHYLTEEQEALLHRLSSNLNSDDFDVMQSILCSFTKPKPAD